MKIYNDEQNAKGIYIVFLVLQGMLLLLMYSIVYASYVATQSAVLLYGLTPFTAYAPTVIVFLAVPVVFMKTASVFRQERRMVAVSWMMALLSIFLVGLMLHLMNITKIS
ncbi:MAG: hypothetical protein Q9M36_07565 [Sulfurovum sp.]|nr:hypothetical protein [Sulfurovum sp.]